MNEMILMLKRRLSVDTLKYIAIIAMGIDHVALAFVDNRSVWYVLMRAIGRITGPVMFFCAVEGYHHTKNLRKYLMRLFAFALISYLPYMFAFHDSFDFLRLNVMFTILIGLLVMHVRRRIKIIWLKILVMFGLIILSIPTDYGVLGVIMMLVFDFYYGSRKNQLVGYGILVMMSGQTAILETLTWPFKSLMYFGRIFWSVSVERLYGLGFLLPIGLLTLYNGKKGRGGELTKWIFYVFYPLHLIVIGFLRVLMR